MPPPSQIAWENDTGMQPATVKQRGTASIPWEIIERTCIAGMTFMDAAKEFGVKEDTIRKRARRYNWPVSKAIGKAVQKAVQNRQVVDKTAQDWLAKGEAHRAVVFDKASGAIKKANMRPPKSWKEFDLADRAARRAANLENADVVQQTLIHINDAIEGYHSEVIEVGVSEENPNSNS
jgi:transposase